VDDAAEARRKARASWSVSRHQLCDPTSDLVQATPSELVAMVHRLTLDAWAMAGLRIPDYARSNAPGRLLRRNS
jgi:hypothetical protein